MKRIDEPASAWVDGKQVDLDNLNGWHLADYLGTGFLMFDRSVLEKMRDRYPEIAHRESYGDSWAFFDCGVVREGKDAVYLSEDYWFCRRARELGIDLVLDPSIALIHWGLYGYGQERKNRLRQNKEQS